MRISLLEVEHILRLKDKYFGEDSKIYLFGSRCDDSQKGGDIDLYLLTENDSCSENKIDFLLDLESAIGEQKVDLVISQNERLIDIEAQKGIELNIAGIKLQKYFHECDKHLQRIESAYDSIKDILPLSVEKYESLSELEVQAIDQYLFRFAKLQDSIGDKIFRQLISTYIEDCNIPFIDILNKLEKIGFLYSAKEWMNLRKIRNEISHQYADESEEMTKATNNILMQKDIIKGIFLNLKDKYNGLSSS